MACPARWRVLTLISKVLRLRGTRLSLSESELHALDHPVLYLWGDRDTFGGPDSARRAAQATLNARLETIPGAGHMPWIEEPDLCAAEISRFLEVRAAG